MSKCEWPTCTSEATHGKMCFRHNSVYGDVKIKPVNVAEQRIEDEKKYKKAKSEFLKEHRFCQVTGCRNTATDVHHKRGRIGALLYNILYFLAVCRKHHKVIEKNPKWAKQEGYSLSRLTKQ